MWDNKQQEFQIFRPCTWSTIPDLDVIKIHRGCSFNVYTVTNVRNKLIVPGFIRKVQDELPYDLNAFYIIPSAIILLCKSYYGYNSIRYYGAGYNGRYQLGINIRKAIVDELRQITFNGDRNINKVCVGLSGWNIIWIRNDGNIYVNGKNNHNQLGYSSDDQRIPKLMTMPRLKVVDAVSSYSFCMLLCDDGSVWSSGYDTEGEMGFAGEEIQKNMFTKIDTFKQHKITQIKATRYFSLFIDEDGNVWSCGNNRYFQLGIRQKSSKLPMKIPYFEQNKIKVVQIECGGNFGIALSDNGNVYCWGATVMGQCGIGNNYDKHQDGVLPTSVIGLDDEFIVDIKAGISHSGCCSRSGNWYLWGCNCSNECIKKDKKFVVKEPFCINKSVIAETKCDRVLDMSLADCNTYFIVE